MSSASKTICKGSECIGKLTKANSEVVNFGVQEDAEHRNQSTQSSMNFGDKDSCSDEECIGKK